MSEKETPNTRISITLPSEEYQQLSDAANEQKRSISWVAGQIIKQKLGPKNPVSEPQGMFGSQQEAILKQTIRVNAVLDHFLNEKKTQEDVFKINQRCEQILSEISERVSEQ